MLTPAGTDGYMYEVSCHLYAAVALLKLYLAIYKQCNLKLIEILVLFVWSRSTTSTSESDHENRNIILSMQAERPRLPGTAV